MSPLTMRNAQIRKISLFQIRKGLVFKYKKCDLCVFSTITILMLLSFEETARHMTRKTLIRKPLPEDAGQAPQKKEASVGCDSNRNHWS